MRILLLSVLMLWSLTLAGRPVQDSVVTVSLKAVPGLQFDQVRFRVKPGARVKLTLDYATAEAIILDPQSAMSAFFGGRIKVDGDFATIVILQGVMATPDPVAREVAEKIREITA